LRLTPTEEPRTSSFQRSTAPSRCWPVEAWCIHLSFLSCAHRAIPNSLASADGTSQVHLSHFPVVSRRHEDSTEGAAASIVTFIGELLGRRGVTLHCRTTPHAACNPCTRIISPAPRSRKWRSGEIYR
jgi:hypothetical protein